MHFSKFIPLFVGLAVATIGVFASPVAVAEPAPAPAPVTNALAERQLTSVLSTIEGLTTTVSGLLTTLCE